MALPLIAAGAMAAMSVAGSAASNRANAKAFKENVKNIKDSYETQIGQLQEQAQSFDRDIRLQMSANRFEGLKNTATTSNVLVEREIAGNTASKQFAQSEINQMMAHNALARKAEDTMASFGVEMENRRREANNAIYAGEAQAKANTQSGLSIASSAISAGMQGYSIGSAFGSLGSTGSTLTGGASANSTKLLTQSDYGSSNLNLNAGGGSGLQR